MVANYCTWLSFQPSCTYSPHSPSGIPRMFLFVFKMSLSYMQAHACVRAYTHILQALDTHTHLCTHTLIMYWQLPFRVSSFLVCKFYVTVMVGWALKISRQFPFFWGFFKGWNSGHFLILESFAPFWSPDTVIERMDTAAFALLLLSIYAPLYINYNTYCLE